MATTLDADPCADAEEVYATLEREARALQRDREMWTTTADTDQLVGQVREVERAERDLLWGRVDDLSEKVGQLCRDRAAVAVAQPHSEAQADEKVQDWTVDAPFPDTEADLPRYSTDHFRPSFPPAYVEPASSSSDWEKPPPSPSTVRRSHAQPQHAEKMALDLESVSLAIERLYRVSPQLANQRVEPDARSLVRKSQLAKLGNAIERLSRGRLDDQRAAPSPFQLDPEQAQFKKARLERLNDTALDRLIDQIDKAASRTLSDQRVDLG